MNYAAPYDTHQLLLIETHFKVYHLSARHSSTKHIGGISALFLQILTNDNYHGKSVTLRLLDDAHTSDAPKFRAVTKSDITEEVRAALHRQQLTNEQAEALYKRFNIY